MRILQPESSSAVRPATTPAAATVMEKKRDAAKEPKEPKEEDGEEDDEDDKDDEPEDEGIIIDW